MLTYWLYTIIGLITFYILYAQFKYKNLRGIPGPPSLPLVGSMLYLQDKRKLLRRAYAFFGSYGPIVKFPLGSQMMIGTIDRDIIEFFLRSPKFTTKTTQYKYLDPWLGKGILNSNDLEWHKTRKMVTPAFHLRILEEHCKIFDSACDILVDILQDNLDKDAFDIYPIITAFTLDVIVESASGIKPNVQKQSSSDYIESIHFMTNLLFKRSLSYWEANDFFYQFSNDYKKQQKAAKILNDMSMKLIQERRKYLEENKHIIEKNGETKKSIFVDILLASTFNGEPLTDDKMQIEVNNYIFGGQDTTSSTLSVMLYELANNLEVQNKIVEELKTIFGNDKNRIGTMQDLNDMKYTESVIKEVLRFYSIVPLIGRKITEDVEYKGYLFPKDVGILFFIYGLNKNPEFFKDPYVFNPDRFLDESSMKPYSFIPFSAGPRNCIGQKYAMLEFKATVAKVLRNFELVSAGPKHKIELLPEIVMKPFDGIMIKIKKRNFLNF